MHIETITQDYSKHNTFSYFLCSDLHFGNLAQDIKLLKEEFDKAADLKSMIFINGDVGEFIIPGDRKRHTNSGMKYKGDNISNKTIEEACKFFKPYKEFIKIISTGNHETSMSKFHSLDPISIIVHDLNREGGNVSHGQYSGFISLRYDSGYKKKGTQRFVIYYNHGQGGSVEISKGTINLNRHMTSKNAEVVWLGHSHSKIIVPSDIVLELDKNDNIIERKRWGIITGCYLKNGHVYDASEEGYKLSFAEERMRTNQQQGGVFMQHVVSPTEIKTSFIV